MRHYATPEFLAIMHIVGPVWLVLILASIIGCHLLNRWTERQEDEQKQREEEEES